jgi:hypothetical protein
MFLFNFTEVTLCRECKVSIEDERGSKRREKTTSDGTSDVTICYSSFPFAGKWSCGHFFLVFWGQFFLALTR